jgi:hypothetical protein
MFAGCAGITGRPEDAFARASYCHGRLAGSSGAGNPTPRLPSRGCERVVSQPIGARKGREAGFGSLDPEPPVELLLPFDLALDPRLTLYDPLVGLARDARLLRPAVAHTLAEAFDRAGVHARLSEILAHHIDLGLLAGAAERDVGALLVGLPATGEDAGGLGGDALAL